MAKKMKVDRAAASKSAWDRAREVAELTGVSVKEARSMLAKDPSLGAKPPKKAGKSKRVTAPSADLAAAEAKLRAKYGDHLVPGTLKCETAGAHRNRRTIVIRCTKPKCGNTRTVATSDLFQVKFCEACAAEDRKAKRRKPPKAKA